MQAIQTRYKGYHFRSRLEARWAILLDALGWTWRYEPEGYNLPSGPYLPDFLVLKEGHYKNESHDFYLEIKGGSPNELERQKARELSQATGAMVVFGVGDPEPLKIYDLEAYELDECSSADCPSFSVSISAYCRWKWARPGVMLGEEDAGPEDVRACNAARSARFEHGECGPT